MFVFLGNNLFSQSKMLIERKRSRLNKRLGYLMPWCIEKNTRLRLAIDRYENLIGSNTLGYSTCFGRHHLQNPLVGTFKIFKSCKNVTEQSNYLSENISQGKVIKILPCSFECSLIVLSANAKHVSISRISKIMTNKREKKSTLKCIPFHDPHDP